MSGLALSSSFRRLGPDTGIDQELVEGRTPLITGGIQFDPAGAVQFKTTEKVLVYFEVYDPLLENQATQPVKLGAVLRIVDRSGGAEKMNSGTVEVSNFIRAGNPVAPVGMRVPVETLSAGAYRLEVKALDSAGRSWTRSADFDVQ
jgi:hypothetical protein